jgi:hypothetical protein
MTLIGVGVLRHEVEWKWGILAIVAVAVPTSALSVIRVLARVGNGKDRP